MEPWVHYIPVDHLFTSLPDVVAWAVQHDDMVREISTNADRYFDAVLSEAACRRRLEILLLEFSKLFTYKVSRNAGAFKYPGNGTYGNTAIIRWNDTSMFGLRRGGFHPLTRHPLPLRPV
jgi:hypothetical protein